MLKMAQIFVMATATFWGIAAIIWLLDHIGGGDRYFKK